MTTERRDIAGAATLVRNADGDTIDGVVEVRAVPFGETLSMWGGLVNERVADDVEVVLRDSQPLPMLWLHDTPIGKWSRDLTRSADGIAAVGRISDTTVGRDVKQLLADGATGGASIGFRVLDSHDETVDERTVTVLDRIELLEISLTPTPAYAGATVTAVRHRPTEEEPRMPDAPDTRTVGDTIATAVAPLTERIDQLEARAFVTSAPEKHWSTEYRSAYDYARSVWNDKSVQFPLALTAEQRALDTSDTGDNGGLIVASWLRDVQRIINRGRPGITAFGVRQLPSTGMSIQWPTYSAATHIGAQSSQRDELTSVAVDIGASSAVSVATYGGAARAAFQLLERADPAFEPIWREAMISSWNTVTDNAFVDGLTLANGSSTVFDFDSGSETGATFRAALFAASVDVETATGMPAEFALVASDVFVDVGGYAGLPDPGYGAGANAEGETSARNLGVEVSGIRVIHDRNLANGTIAVSNSTAAGWHESGPFFVNQDQAGILARDMAVYSYAAAAQYISTGVVKLAASYA